MRTGRYLLARRPCLGPADWSRKPGADLAPALERHVRDKAQLRAMTDAFFDTVTGLPADMRRALAKALAGGRMPDLSSLSGAQRDAFDILRTATCDLAKAGAALDQALVRTQADMPGWFDALPAAFRARLYDRLPQVEPGAGTLNKKQRGRINRQMRLCQRALYRTTPFPGLAGIALFDRGGSRDWQPVEMPKDTEAVRDANLGPGAEVALNASFDRDARRCRYLVPEGGAMTSVELPDPAPVHAAVAALGLSYAPRRADPSPALDALIGLGVASRPDRLAAIAAPFTHVPTSRDAAQDLSLRMRQAADLWPHLAAFAATGQADALRAWAAGRYGGQRTDLRRLLQEAEALPAAEAPLPPLAQDVLLASAQTAASVTLDLPELARAPRAAVSLTARLMPTECRDGLVLNGLLPGGRRQVARYFAHPALRPGFGIDTAKTPLLLRPIMGQPFQTTPRAGADVLYLPGEPFDPAEPCVGPDEITLDWTGPAPRLIGARGTEYTPVYLGCVREHALHPGLAVLLALGQGPVTEVRERLLQGHLLLDQQMLRLGLPLPVRRPRITAAGVVLQRRRWASRARDLPRRAQYATLGDWMTALTEWRLAHDLPRRVSAQALRAGRAEFGQTPRVFADFTCPVSADDVVSVLRAGADDWLTFEELLPDPTRCPGGATEFLVELES